MLFAEILKELNNGKVVRRSSYSNNFVIYKQIASNIPSNMVLGMRSTPSDMKVLLMRHNLGIHFKNQYIIYDFEDGTATYVIFDGDDINATDWEVVDINTYNPYE